MSDETTGDTIGDIGISGVTVTLFDQSMVNQIAQTVTDLAGNYAFNNLLAGSYIIVETNLPGYIDIYDIFGNPLDNIITTTLIGGQNETDQDFVDRHVGSITGSVKEDLDNNDSGDTALPGVTVTLLDSLGNNIATTVTDFSGLFTFVNVPAGSYTVVETNLLGYTDVSDNGGNPLDNSIPVVLSSGANTTGLQFVDESLGSITGSVKEDLDNNDSGDVPLPRVIVTLLNSAGDEITTEVTDSNGTFTFVNVPAGNYTVVEAYLSKYTNVSDSEGNPLDNSISVVIGRGAGASGLLFVNKDIIQHIIIPKGERVVPEKYPKDSIHSRS